jgi:hypothetical protein
MHMIVVQALGIDQNRVVLLGYDALIRLIGRLADRKQYPITPTNRTLWWFQRAIGAENGPTLKPVNSAVLHILEKLNSQSSPLDPFLTTKERNIIIRAR